MNALPAQTTSAEATPAKADWGHIQKFRSPTVTQENLLDLIKSAREGKIKLPEFQRNFVWQADAIVDLIISILCGFHIGAFLMLDVLAQDEVFESRVIEGLSRIDAAAAACRHASYRLVLDGQQRLTSLFYALYQPTQPLKGTLNGYRFFVRLDKINSEKGLDEAVVSISRRDTRGFAEMEALIALGLAIPMTLFLDSGAFHRWLYSEQHYWTGSEQDAIGKLYHNFSNFLVPVIGISADMGLDYIASNFERLNRTGVSLGIFDLMTAILYRKEVKLHALLARFEVAYPHIAAVLKPEFLLKFICTLEGREPRRSNLLDVMSKMPPDRFQFRWDEAVTYMTLAYERIVTIYGAFEARWMPYSTIIIPLAIMLHIVDHQARTSAVSEVDAYRMIDIWYWNTVFKQRYDGSVDTYSFLDQRTFAAWLNDPAADLSWPTNLHASDLELDVSEGKSAVYRGLMCVVARHGARDLRTGQSAILTECNDEHIFARDVYAERHPVNLIYNRTLLNARTNRHKFTKKPSEALRYALEQHGGDEAALLTTLDTHYIDAAAYRALLADDFGAFTQARRAALLAAVDGLLRP